MNISIDPLAAFLTAVAAYTAALAWVFRVQSVAVTAREGVRRIEETRKADKLAYDARLERIENIASDVKALTQAVASAQAYNAERFDDLKSEIGAVRGSAARAREMASRGSRKGGEAGR